MTADIQKFYRATNPSLTLSADKAEDRKYYIDCASVRGGDIIGLVLTMEKFWSLVRIQKELSHF
ncbi:MAG: hypothetical protein KME25_30430 [Symplocastrum torsivum CPER-KK1]|uniref:Uncharacterized protein n=1 Tax=Symplocastrum torsivum CPER-KK1 TaxID=450513 RepID=A0A951PST3_9CYAN|nr:hypothetical protein [Symplocastrum torsivum CPER-KK1]